MYLYIYIYKHITPVSSTFAPPSASHSFRQVTHRVPNCMLGGTPRLTPRPIHHGPSSRSCVPHGPKAAVRAPACWWTGLEHPRRFRRALRPVVFFKKMMSGWFWCMPLIYMFYIVIYWFTHTLPHQPNLLMKKATCQWDLQLWSFSGLQWNPASKMKSFNIKQTLSANSFQKLLVQWHISHPPCEWPYPEIHHAGQPWSHPHVATPALLPTVRGAWRLNSHGPWHDPRPGDAAPREICPASETPRFSPPRVLGGISVHFPNRPFGAWFGKGGVKNGDLSWSFKPTKKKKKHSKSVQIYFLRSDFRARRHGHFLGVDFGDSLPGEHRKLPGHWSEAHLTTCPENPAPAERHPYLLPGTGNDGKCLENFTSKVGQVCCSEKITSMIKAIWQYVNSRTGNIPKQ